MRFQLLLSLWGVTSWLRIDKIPESQNQRDIFLSKLRLCHALLKQLIKTRPHMSTSRCGNILCVRREREGVTPQRSVQRVINCLNRGLCANTYEHHPSVCHVTLFPSRAWTDGKPKDIIKCLYFLFWKLKLVIMERGVAFLTWLVVFGQSQFSGSVGQSEQTVLVGRRDFVEN